MIKRICVLMVILQLIALPSYAQDYNALRKFSRGMANVLLSWTEIPHQMIEANKKEEEVPAFFLGAFRGALYTFGRIFVGAYEIITFPLPTYKPLVKPEFLLSDFQNKD